MDRWISGDKRRKQDQKIPPNDSRRLGAEKNDLKHLFVSETTSHSQFILFSDDLNDASCLDSIQSFLADLLESSISPLNVPSRTV
jgi:hypothetical protein